MLLQRIVFKEQLWKEAAVALSTMYKYNIEKWVLKHKSEREGKPIRKGNRLNKAEQNFKWHLLRFKKKETEMRKFDNSTEVIFLSKGIDNLSEVIDTLKKD